MPGSDTLAPLFAGHRALRAVVDAVLEGRQGTARSDGDAARLSLGCYEIFGGDPSSAGARRLVAGAWRRRSWLAARLGYRASGVCEVLYLA